MKIYHLKRTQFLPITLSAAWEFFSTPKNLAKITPEHMGFQILYISGSDKAYAGQIIQYNVSVLPGIKVNWVTEIAKWVAVALTFVSGWLYLWRNRELYLSDL